MLSPVLIYIIRHFRPKLIHLNRSVYCTPIDGVLKMWFNDGSGPTDSWVVDVFLESIVVFFGQNKYTNIRRFWTIFRHKTRVFSPKKVQKKYSFQYNDYTIYILKKLKVGHFYCLPKTFKYIYCPKFWT